MLRIEHDRRKDKKLKQVEAFMDDPYFSSLNLLFIHMAAHSELHTRSSRFQTQRNTPKLLGLGVCNRHESKRGPVNCCKQQFKAVYGLGLK